MFFTNDDNNTIDTIETIATRYSECFDDKHIQRMRDDLARLKHNQSVKIDYLDECSSITFLAHKHVATIDNLDNLDVCVLSHKSESCLQHIVKSHVLQLASEYNECCDSDNVVTLDSNMSLACMFELINDRFCSLTITFDSETFEAHTSC
jgi:hypothetical protein